MKALKYFIMPVLLTVTLISNVYAESPAYLKSTAFNALGNGVESFFKTIYYLIMFGIILAAAFYVTKYLAKKGMVRGKTRNMKLIESMPLGVDRSLHLVKVGSQYFLLGSASKSLFMISELDHEKLFEEELKDAIDIKEFDFESYDGSLEGKDFSSYLNSMKSNLKRLKTMVRGNKSDES
jgi:flagellar protein FliO/FliZ